MGPSGWTLLALALLAALAVAVQAVRHPILARMGARNALRRPRQTATVVAGLMVGTAIISAALVAGDSAGYAIRGYVYQSLGVIDESVSLEGYPFFPEAAYDHFLEDPEVDSRFDGIAAHVIWDAAVESPRTGLFEPLTFLAGYDLERDAAFGDFELVGGGSSDGRSLERGDAIVTSHLAEQLEARVGDRLNVTFTPPLDPLLPEVAFLNGTLAAAVQPSPLSPTLKPVSATHAVEVTPGATRLVLAVAWVPGPATSPAPPTLSAAAPDGTRYSSSGPSSGAAPGRTLLNVTAPPDATLQDGNWTVTVASSVALQQAYVGAAVVLTPVYDLAELRDRARALERQYGDLVEELDVLSPSSPPVERSFRVAAITDGGRGDVFDFRDALFLRLDEAQDMLGREGQVNLIKFSNPGGPASGVHGTDEAMKTLNASLERLQREHPDSAALQNLETRALKETYLKTADETGQTLTGLLVFAGSLSIITGLLLIVNIFTMLAEERRGELGMARAVGMSRADLVRLFLIEGSLYAVVAAFLGALLGLALAAGMVAVMNAIVSGLAADVSFPPIAYRPSAGAVLVAFSVGALLTFATIFFASRRASRLNVVRAIRRIEEPDRTGRLLPSLLAGLPLIAAGLAALALGWVPGAVRGTPFADHRFTVQVAGGLLAAVGLGLALRPAVARRRLLPTLAGLLALYYASTYFLITKYENIPEANVVGPVRGVLFTLCVVVLVAHADRLARLLGRALSRLRRLRAIAVPAMSYPLHKKFRTGMTLAMFSVVILAIAFFSIVGALFETDPARQTGGFDVEGRTSLDVEDLASFDRGLLPAGLVREEVQILDTASEDPGFITVSGERTGMFGEVYHHVYGYGDDFAAAQGFTLLWRLPEFADDGAAYRAVLERGDAVIVSYQYSTNERNQDLSHGVGETLELHLGDEVEAFTVVGIQEQYHFPGVFLGKERVKALFPHSEQLFLFQLGPGADAGDAAVLLEKNYRGAGLDAKDTVAEVVREQESFRQVLGAMKLFLGLGLVVGVLSLGIVTSRNVLERRQEIGMLRALGYTGRQVRRIFLVEVSFTLLLGALVGLACAIVVTYGLWHAVIRDLRYDYVIPWGEVGILLGVSYVVALLATWAPIGRSAKVAPAEALRYVE